MKDVTDFFDLVFSTVAPEAHRLLVGLHKRFPETNPTGRIIHGRRALSATNSL
jgi:hypothetical protein